MKCERCGSAAINPHLHGRDKIDLDLCDVCYWRKRAEYFLECAEVREKRLCAERLHSILSMSAEEHLARGDKEGYMRKRKEALSALFGEEVVEKLFAGEDVAAQELMDATPTYQETHPLEIS